MVDGVSCDYMHGVLLGVVKLLLSLWIDPSHCRNLPCDIRTKLPVISECLQQLQVSCEITHGPRGFEHLKNWKGISL